MNGTAWEERVPFHVKLEFEDRDEAKELATELMQWKPTGGWSDKALSLFELLRSEVGAI